jgi:hypothetical protein
MPIKDLQKDKPGLARAGIIRLGYKVKKCKDCKAVNLATNKKCQQCGKSNFSKRKIGNEYIETTYPTASDHFVLTDAPGVAEAIGNPKPRELRVWFPFNQIQQVFPAYHQYWVAGGLVCRGDGEHVLYGIDPQKGDVIVRDGQALREFESSAPDGNIKFIPGDQVACPGLAHNLYKKCEHCKPNAMLIVLLRDVPRLAYYQISTTSIHNIVRLTEQLTYIQETIGRLQGVPFILKLRPEKISVPKSDGRVRTEKYLLSLEVDPEWMQRLLTAQSELADPMRQLASEVSEEDVINIEPVTIHPPSDAMEPPLWMAPNGGDDSADDWIDRDYNAFRSMVIERIPFYLTGKQVDASIERLELVYDPQNEAMIFDALAKHAEAQADAKAEQQEMAL